MLQPLHKFIFLSSLCIFALHSNAESVVWDEQQTSSDLQRQIAASQINALKSDQQSFLTLQRTAMTPFVKGTVILVNDETAMLFFSYMLLFMVSCPLENRVLDPISLY